MTTEELIEAAIRCPIDWPKITGVEYDMNGWLIADWYDCICEHAVSISETTAVYEYALYGHIRRDSENAAVLNNLEFHRSEVTACYASRGGRLANLTFLEPSYDRKHFKGRLPTDALLEVSRLGASIFEVNYTPEQLSRLFWFWFIQYFDLSMTEGEMGLQSDLFTAHPDFYFWKELVSSSSFRIAFETNRTIGAANGQPARHVCFDMVLDSRTLHAYPVSEQEAEQIMRGGRLIWVSLGNL